MKGFLFELTLLAVFVFPVFAFAQDLGTPSPAMIQTPFGQIPNPAGMRGGKAAAEPQIVRILPTVGSNGLPNGAWWNNKELVNNLNLSEEQKARIEGAYENHRQTLATYTTALEKEDSQLSTLLAADPVDTNAVYSQIDRVIQARGELERTNSIMTLEMRQVLTKAQWSQLSARRTVTLSSSVTQSRSNSTSQLPRVDGVTAAANLITSSAVRPAYPALAAQARIQGTVILEAEISAEGGIQGLKVISGHPLLQQAAIDAVRQWRYTPFLLNGKPAAVVTTITVNIP